MECIKFNLYGDYASFTVPDTNKNCEKQGESYLSFSHIHKVALLGFLGAVLGYEGYSYQKLTETIYPEFYQKLQGVEVSIVPKKFNFNVSFQPFINSTGLSNVGYTQLLTQTVLEDVSWDIYILQGKIENDVWNNLKQQLLDRKYIFCICLGQKKFEAHFKDVEIINIDEVNKDNEIENIDSLFLYDMLNDWEEPLEEEGNFINEDLPVSLDKKFNLYQYKRFVLTNYDLELNSTNNLYKYKDKVLFFI